MLRCVLCVLPRCVGLPIMCDLLSFSGAYFVSLVLVVYCVCACCVLSWLMLFILGCALCCAFRFVLVCRVVSRCIVCVFRCVCALVLLIALASFVLLSVLCFPLRCDCVFIMLFLLTRWLLV